MTNAEWMIKNNIPFKNVGHRPCSNPSCESIGYYNMDGNFNEGYKGTWLGRSLSESILIWLDMEHKEPPILDESEREYLSAVIKPFRPRVKYIVKLGGGREWIKIDLRGSEIYFPPFEMGTMYKGMELFRHYTLEELGL